MALVQCPDCGKKVSSRVQVCPDCGCPAEFFVALSNDHDRETPVDVSVAVGVPADVANENAGTLQELAENESPAAENDNSVETEVSDNNTVLADGTEEESLKPRFSLAGHTLSYGVGTEKYAGLFGDFLHAADMGYETMLKAYADAKTVGKALETLPPIADKLIGELVTGCCKTLYSMGVNITAEQFLRKYDRKYTMYYSSYSDVTVGKYAEIMGQKDKMAGYRNSVKASRGRWVGGGFGVKGAVKGALTASAMNMGSDFLHSFGDSARERSDNQAIQSKLRDLYKKSEGQLCHSVWTCMMNVYKSMIEELKANNLLPPAIHLDKEKAETIYKNSNDFETDPVKIRDNMTNCIFYYPGEKKYYLKIKDDLLKESSQLEEFSKFWHLEYLLKDIVKEKNQNKEFNEFVQASGIDKFNFNDYSAENAALLLYKTQRKYIPKSGSNVWGNKVKGYFDKFSCKRGEYKKAILTDYFPESITSSEYLSDLRLDESDLHISSVTYFWMRTEEDRIAEDEINRFFTDKDDKVQFYYDSSLLENCTKGIAVSKKYVVDLKSKTRITIKNVCEVNVVADERKRYYIKISDGNQTILFQSDEIKEIEHAAWYLRNVFKTFFVRFCGNTMIGDIHQYADTPVRKEAERVVAEKEKEEAEKRKKESEKQAEIQRQKMAANEIRMEQYIELISNAMTKRPNDFQPVLSNQFRRRFKYLVAEIYKEEVVNKYDFELEEGEVRKFFERLGMKGEYILYAEKGNEEGYCLPQYRQSLIITDQRIYCLEGAHFNGKVLYVPLKKISEILEIRSANNRDCVEDQLLSYSKEDPTEVNYDLSDYPLVGGLITRIDAALDFEPHKEDEKYYGKWTYVCDECGSTMVGKSLLDVYRCKRCRNNKTISKIGTEGIYTEDFEKALLNPTDKDKELWEDEELQETWLKKYGLWDIDPDTEDADKIKPQLPLENSVPDITSIDTANDASIERTDAVDTVDTIDAADSVDITGNSSSETENPVIVTNPMEEPEKMLCPHCGKEIRKGTKFCNFCGQSTQEKRTCPNCGKQILATAKFCNFCGEIVKENES